MSSENKIQLKDFDICMVFTIQPYDGEMFDYEMKISCVEDIWYPLGLIHERKFKEVFPDEYGAIAHAELTGLKIKAKDETDTNKIFFLLGNNAYGSITVDYSKLNDDNADKIQEIRKIIGK